MATTIQTIDTILRDHYIDKMVEYMRRGHTLHESYVLADQDLKHPRPVENRRVFR